MNDEKRLNDEMEARMMTILIEGFDLDNIEAQRIINKCCEGSHLQRIDCIIHWVTKIISEAKVLQENFVKEQLLEYRKLQKEAERESFINELSETLRKLNKTNDDFTPRR